MATRDIRSSISATLPQYDVISSDTTTAGAIIDTADFEGGIAFLFAVVAFSDGTYTPLIEESDDSGMSGSNEVPDEKLIGTEAGAALSAATADDDILPSIGVFSNKRYLRASIVSTGTTSGATVATVAVQQPELTPAEGLSA